MKKILLTLAGLALIVAGCASMQAMPSSAELDQQTKAVIKASFTDKGIAKLDRLNQDMGQAACSSPNPPSEAVAKQIQDAALATIQWPADGRYLDNWQEGEKLAQNGRGMTWRDKAGSPNGGSCYNCHQLSKTELSYGTIGPSLYHYAKLRGVADPYSKEAAPVVQYTWAKLWNSKAYSACSNMPRFGHAGLLTQDQIRDLMALLLDPKSPINQ